MNQQSKYVLGIQSRTKARFVLGALARIKNFLRNSYAVYIARKNGAKIGDAATIPISLAKKANSNLTVGNHSSIQTDILDLRAPISIGNYVIIGNNVEILTSSHNVDSPEWDYKSYGILIEDYAWLATNVLILPSCREIKRGAVVAAGSVVAKDVQAMEIVSGNQAAFLRKRNEVHYNLCVEGLLGNDLKTYLKVRKKITG